MLPLAPKDFSSETNSKAVIIIVLIILVILATILVLLYYKRGELSDYFHEHKKAKASLEFSEYPSKLTANPDFMASLAPQWPEPEPDPTEDQAFIQVNKSEQRQ